VGNDCEIKTLWRDNHQMFELLPLTTELEHMKTIWKMWMNMGFTCWWCEEAGHFVSYNGITGRVGKGASFYRSIVDIQGEILYDFL
jgi:hypothetical protein